MDLLRAASFFAMGGAFAGDLAKRTGTWKFSLIASASALGALLLGGSSAVPVARAQTPAPTPLQLFQRMLPVVRHDRCINCHGDVDPITGANHEGGSIDVAKEKCTKCHTALKEWRTPDPVHFFVRKSDRELCTLFSDFAAKQGHPLFISNHLRGDALIVDAFGGMVGGANTGEPERPPINQDEFIKLAQDWLDRGHGACVMDGTITHEETVHSEDVWKITSNSDDSVVQDARRTVTISGSGDGYRAEIETTGTVVGTHVQHSQNAQGLPCTETTTTKDQWSGKTSGKAKIAVTFMKIFGDTEPSKGQQDYRIDVTLPAEHTTRRSSGAIANGCGALVPSLEGQTQELDWGSSTFVLEGHLDNTRQMYVVGACDRMVKHGDVGDTKRIDEMPCNRFGTIGNAETPLLMNQADVAFHDGSDVVFRTQDIWNIRYTK